MARISTKTKMELLQAADHGEKIVKNSRYIYALSSVYDDTDNMGYLKMFVVKRLEKKSNGYTKPEIIGYVKIFYCSANDIKKLDFLKDLY